MQQERSSCFNKTLPIQEAIGYRRGVGFTLTHLGHALADTGALDDAEQAFAQALATRRELDPESPLAVDDLARPGARHARPG